MRLLFIDDFKLGVLKGDTVVDVSDVVRDIPHTGPGDLMSGLIGRFADYKGRLEAAANQGRGVPVSQVRIRPPLPKPTNIECMAVNYMEDGTRSEPAPINAFHKSPSSIIGDGDTMVLPDVPATIFEGEAEMALVIGKRASNVSPAEAMSYVFGYLNFIDGSARGLPPAGNTFYQMKSRDSFAPMGPYLVTADEVRDRCDIRCGHAERTETAEHSRLLAGVQSACFSSLGAARLDDELNSCAIGGDARFATSPPLARKLFISTR